MDESTRIKMIIGDRIRTVRTHKRLTQKTLSELTGLNDKYISRLENGEENVTLDTLLKITTELEVNFEELFKGTQQDYNESGLIINQIISLLQTKKEEDQKFVYDLLNLIFSRK